MLSKYTPAVGKGMTFLSCDGEINEKKAGTVFISVCDLMPNIPKERNHDNELFKRL